MLRESVIAGCILGPTGCADGCPVTREHEVHEVRSLAEISTLDPTVDAIRVRGVARTDLAGFKSWTVAGNRNMRAAAHTAALVPFVPEGWTTADPVPLWVRLNARVRDEHQPAMGQALDTFAAAARAGPIELGLAQRLEDDVDMEGTNAFQIGAIRAMQTHQLTSPVGTPLCVHPPGDGPLRLKP